MRTLTDARHQLRGVAAELAGIFQEMEGLARAMGASAEERSAEDLGEEPSPAVELRTAILCGMQDHLRPLIRDFLAASGCTPEEVARATPALPEDVLLPGPCAAAAPQDGAPEAAP